MNNIQSRFFTINDNKDTNIETLDNIHWYSKKYEYAWASEFVKKNDICLDAGTGILDHKFKDYLSENTKCCYAVDKIDIGIEDTKTLKFKNIDLLELDSHFKNNFFDKIYCLSTLEQNNHDTIIKILKQFKILLKQNGKIIITCHHPYLITDMLIHLVDMAGLIFSGDVNMEIDKDTVLRGQDSCKCYRAVLEINTDEIKERETKIENIDEIKPLQKLETK